MIIVVDMSCLLLHCLCALSVAWSYGVSPVKSLGLLAGSNTTKFPKTSAAEISALSQFYFSLDGPAWVANDGWASLGNTTNNNSTIIITDPCTPPGWFGVKCNSASHVISLTLRQNGQHGSLPRYLNLSHLITLDLSNDGFGVAGANSFAHGIEGLCNLMSVEIVRLTYGNISGTLPDCLINLKSLVVLGLDYNRIQGSTPDAICALPEIQQIRLRGNAMVGSIPKCIGSAKSLALIDYTSVEADGRTTPGSQSLSGSLPDSLCQLVELQQLILQYTQGLTGSIPSCLGSIQPLLTYLDLEENQLVSNIPESLCTATSLSSLYLYGNSLTGTLPSCFGSLSNLKGLQLQRNSLSGPIPLELCKLNHLTQLALYENALTGGIPDCLSGLSLLTILELQHNDLGGTLPETLCELTKLQYLVLNANGLTGTLPSCLGNLTKLIFLEFNENYLQGTISPSFCGLKHLTNLNLGNNKLSSNLPSCIGSLQSLTDFEVQRNLRLSGSIPESMCNLTSLVYIYMYDTSIGGTIPVCFGTSFPSLQALLLHNNRLQGDIPPKWQLESLGSIVLSNNKELSGTLPNSLFLQHSNGQSEANTYHRLVAVIIEGTSISGSLPESVCRSTGLVTLALSANEISGTLPSCFTSLRLLSTISIANNAFHGPIPALGNMSSLKKFDISANEFDGRVPASLGDISRQLEVASIELNRLSCALPLSVRQWKLAINESKVSILRGNHFGCDGHNEGGFGNFFAWSMEDAAPLSRANPEEFGNYRCGSSAYILPVIWSLVVVIPAIIAMVRALTSGVLAMRWNAQFLSGLLFEFQDSDHSNDLRFSRHCDLASGFRCVRVLASSVIFAGVVGALLSFTLLSTVATSDVDCQYAEMFSFANKSGNGWLLSVVTAVSVSLSVFIALSAWSFRSESNMMKFCSTTHISGIVGSDFHGDHKSHVRTTQSQILPSLT
jgi:Leucine-rich repeat (LRR) protein